MKKLILFLLFISITCVILFCIFKVKLPLQDQPTHQVTSKVKPLDNIDNNEPLDKQTKLNVDEFLKSNHFNGNITIFRKNKLIMNESYGFKNFENNIKNDNHSMYLIGSANKFLTGIMLRQLEEEGKLNLDDNVNKYIPDFQLNYPLTLRDLMLHQSGLAKFKPDWSQFGLDSSIRTIKSTGIVPSHYRTYQYNDANYITLAKVIENVTHKSFEYNLKHRIINKANLKYTSNYDSKSHEKHFVSGYKNISNQNIYIQPNNLDKYDGAGNVYISTHDMAQLVSKFKENKLVSKTSTQNLLSLPDQGYYPSSYRYGFYKFKDYERYRGIFFANDIVTYSNDEYIVTIASNQLYQPYKSNTENMLKYIYKQILHQELKQK